MQIVCPNCQTAYQVAELAIGASGRQVRCTRCQNAWRATAPADEPAPVAAPTAEAAADDASVAAFRAELGNEPTVPPAETPAAEPVAGTQPEPAAEDPPSPAPAETAAEQPPDDEPASNAPPDDAAVAAEATPPAEAEPVALSDISIPVAPQAAGEAGGAAQTFNTIDNEAPDIETVAARRARRVGTAAHKPPSRGRLPLAAAIAVLMAVSAGAIGLRKEIVRHAPQLASFYGALGMPVNLRGLVFTDLKIGNEIHDGVPVLVIEGAIVSLTSKTVDVPRLRFALRNASGAEVYSWTAPPSQPTLSAYEALPFRSRLASPPAEGHDIQVRFFLPRDTVASLR